jgi:succinyl-CoA synthetase beta subunit
MSYNCQSDSLLILHSCDSISGTNVDEARSLLNDSGLPIIAANDLTDAASKVVATLAH